MLIVREFPPAPRSVTCATEVPPREEYNYVLVDVESGQKTKFTLNRYRPGSAAPFGTEALFT